MFECRWCDIYSLTNGEVARPMQRARQHGELCHSLIHNSCVTESSNKQNSCLGTESCKKYNTRVWYTEQQQTQLMRGT